MRYICSICGHIYDESKEDIPFEELPKTWECPVCHAKKRKFRPETKQKGKFSNLF